MTVGGFAESEQRPCVTESLTFAGNVPLAGTFPAERRERPGRAPAVMEVPAAVVAGQPIPERPAGATSRRRLRRLFGG
jgi:hypothetical protein